MSGIMEKLFGPRPNMQPQGQQGNQQNQMPTPGNIPQGTGMGSQGNSVTAPNGTTPTVNPQTGLPEAKQEESPFAPYAKLWDTKNADGTDPKPADPLYKIDEAQIMGIASKTDFKSVATPEMMAVMAKGGEAGLSMMMEVMQKMSQLTYANAAVAATKIAESGITRALAAQEAKLPNLIRTQSVAESMAAKNPALRDPAVQPVVQLIREQMAQKYPNASQSELQTQAETYFLSLGTAFAPKPVVDPNAPVPGQTVEQDWDKYFTL